LGRPVEPRHPRQPATTATGITDLLIGALAHEIGALVWSLDADFRRLQRLRLVQLY
jgi:predicted nucleic acid-binding protein